VSSNVYRVHCEYERPGGKDDVDRMNDVKAGMIDQLHTLAGPLALRDGEITWTWELKPYSLSSILTAELRHP